MTIMPVYLDEALLVEVCDVCGVSYALILTKDDAIGSVKGKHRN